MLAADASRAPTAQAQHVIKRVIGTPAIDALRACDRAVVATVPAHEVLLAVGVGGACILLWPDRLCTLASLDIPAETANLERRTDVGLTETELPGVALGVGSAVGRAVPALAVASIILPAGLALAVRNAFGVAHAFSITERGCLGALPAVSQTPVVAALLAFAIGLTAT